MKENILQISRFFLWLDNKYRKMSLLLVLPHIEYASSIRSPFYTLHLNIFICIGMLDCIIYFIYLLYVIFHQTVSLYLYNTNYSHTYAISNFFNSFYVSIHLFFLAWNIFFISLFSFFIFVFTVMFRYICKTLIICIVL